MAVPKKKKSKSKRNMRRSHDSVKMPNIATCPHCHEPVLQHHVCSGCGLYRGRTIIRTEGS
ncbi:MAG: 50S ribosomal protein L32 [Thermodesulfobacteriota bacterium]|nr:50S ribosomal protein L32 [Thermodesulfobacteriota bacterium]